MTTIVTLENPALNQGKLRYRHLLGKKFTLGKDDCYEMMRRMFKDNLNIELTSYARPNDFWLEDDIDPYVGNYPQEGFFLLDDPRLEDLRPFDTFLIGIPDPRRPEKTVTNHCAIYIGDGMVIHHRLGTLSSVAPYRGVLRNLTTHVIRHKDVPDLRSTNTAKVDILDHLLPHKREFIMGVINEANQK